MVSLEATSRKYRGKTASGYEAKRRKQMRWHLENEAVEKFIEGASGSVLDVPVGTGRFLPLYERMLSGMEAVGVDISEEMLALARRKSDFPLEVGDATKLRFTDATFDVVVCVRFLDLIDEAAMCKVVTELCRVARERIILTIRLGEKYIPKSNTATHDEKKFLALIRRLGWIIAGDVPVFRAGWHVFKLERRGHEAHNSSTQLPASATT